MSRACGDGRPAVLVLAGATASGKTAAALALAERFDAEIVGADSRQIYRGMPIGTAAPTDAECARVPHHLVAFLDPSDRYSAVRFVDDALRALDGIAARGKRAIVVGGTGFYVRALCGDARPATEFDAALRERLRAEAEIATPLETHARLAAIDPRRAAMLPVGDVFRVVRALEVATLRAGPSAGLEDPPTPPSLVSRAIPYRKVVLTIDDATHAARIEARVDGMLAAGFLGEAERIGAEAVAANAVGYPQALAYLAGRSTAAELRAALVRATRRYAKRQRTWFRGEPDVVHLDADDLAGFACTLPGWSST